MTLKEQMKETSDKVKEWAGENKGNILYGLYVVGLLGAVASPFIRRSKRNYLEARREKQIYDPSMGFYWETKRPLTNNQKLMIEQRHRNGEGYGKILKEMHLLRK